MARMRFALVLQLLLAAALAGCGRDAPRFRGADLTGADWGRSFSLPDFDGRMRTLADFRGKYVVLFFGFTQCPDVCPTSLARLEQAKRQLGPDGARVRVLFVTLDPERDTPQLLREYLAAFDPQFVGLRGDAAATRRTASEFKVFYEKVPTGSSYTINHTAMNYVFDAQGRLRLGLSDALSPDDFAADLRTLMHERS